VSGAAETPPDETVHRRAGRAPSEPGITGAPRPLLSREAFARLVLVERRRAERVGGSFGILVVQGLESLDPADTSLGQSVPDILVNATRTTDVAGWIEPPSVLGILVPQLPEGGPWAAVERVRSRIERALGRGASARGTVQLVGRVFPDTAPGREEMGSARGSSETASLLTRLLYPELEESRGARRRSAALKRGLDVAGSAILLTMLAPLGLLIAGLVRGTSPGPVLFRQARVGYRGRPFTMLKFRTMYVNADESVHREFVSRFIADGQHATPPNGAGLFKLVGDPRVTPVGRLLRKTSLDELPQLWNVLRGDMSLVGPRPPLPYEVEQYALWHRRRLFEARPGITGLWQVRGRSRSKFDEIVRLDLRYARTQSLSTDLGLLLETPRAVISGKGAG
jgi:lipopolysaccharide/colanic/teichoic acid biosynthesis glycosyltransferase